MAKQQFLITLETLGHHSVSFAQCEKEMAVLLCPIGNEWFSNSSSFYLKKEVLVCCPPLSLSRIWGGGAATGMRGGLQSHDLLLSPHSAPWASRTKLLFKSVTGSCAHSFPCWTTSLILAALQVSRLSLLIMLICVVVRALFLSWSLGPELSEQFPPALRTRTLPSPCPGARCWCSVSVPWAVPGVQLPETILGPTSAWAVPISQFMYFLPSSILNKPLGLTSSFLPFQFSDFTGSGYALAFNDHQQLLSVQKKNYYQPRCAAFEDQ